MQSLLQEARTHASPFLCLAELRRLADKLGGSRVMLRPPLGTARQATLTGAARVLGDFAQASPASAGPPEAVASQRSRLQATPLRTPPAEDPFAASTGLQPSPAQQSGMAASANGELAVRDANMQLA